MEKLLPFKILKILPYVLAVIFLIPVVQPVRAQDQASVDLQKMVFWSQRASDTYEEGILIYNSLVELEISIDNYLDSASSRAEIDRLFNRINKNVDEQIKLYSDSLNTFIGLDIGPSRFDAVEKDFDTFIGGMPTFLRDYQVIVGGLYESAISEDFETYDRLSADSISGDIFLLEAENRRINITSLAIPEGHPAEYINGIYVDTNSAMAEVYSIYRKIYLSEEIKLVDSTRLIRSYVEAAMNKLRKGMNSNSTFWTQIVANRNLSSKTRHAYDKMQEHYWEAFDTENKLVDAYVTFLEAADGPNEIGVDSNLAEYEQISQSLIGLVDELNSLVEQRAWHQNRALEIAAEFVE